MQDKHHPQHRDKRAWGMVPTSIVENDGKRVSNAGKDDEAQKTQAHEDELAAQQEKHNEEMTLREAMDEKLEEAAHDKAEGEDVDEREEKGEGKGVDGKAPAGPVGGKGGESEEERKERIRIKNRRKMYLDSHPTYFENPDLELADPLLYDRCIRRFQSATEREEEGKKKGYSGVMEADLWRSEAKLAALAGKEPGRESNDDGYVQTERPAGTKYVAGNDGEVVPEDEDEIPITKEEGAQKWREAMEFRFLQGKDTDFYYLKVDGDESLDVLERQEKEEKYFEDEEPEWANGAKEKGKSDGETGIQDF